MAELELEISPPAVTPRGEATFQELVEDLRELGHEATVVPAYEQRAQFQPLEVVIRLVEDLGEEAIGAIVTVAVGWIRRVVHRRRGGRPNIVRLYGPNHEVLREVEVDEDVVTEPDQDA
jgi:hypothetical protein